MNYSIESWSIQNLFDHFQNDNLILDPPYQRRFIWSDKDQKILLDSLLNNIPIPNLFLYKKPDGKFEIVDGQQRTQTIIAFLQGSLKNFENEVFDPQKHGTLLNFSFPVVIIEEIKPDEITIEDFYGLVNSAGKHLNRPEIKKAQYFETRFLKLINEFSSNSMFIELDIFTDTSLRRMNDLEFVSELIVLLNEGITDKKEKGDKTYENDISDEIFTDLKLQFENLILLFQAFNRMYPIKKTRYRQKNDFYTLTGFYAKNQDKSQAWKVATYETLVLIGEDITPSNEECLPFQNYGRNCVTQSNSKSARLERNNFLDQLFLNENSAPNLTQREVLKYYELLDAPLHNIDGCFLIDLNQLKGKKSTYSFSNGN